MNATKADYKGAWIVWTTLVFMALNWVLGIYQALAWGPVSVQWGINSVISLWLMIWLWRGARWARWIVCVLHGFSGLGLLFVAAVEGSAGIAGVALIVCAIAVGLALPCVGRYQAHQRSGDRRHRLQGAGDTRMEH